MLPDAASEYAITHLSANFFVNESEQIDAVTVFNDGSTTSDSGNLTTTALSPVSAWDSRA